MNKRILIPLLIISLVILTLCTKKTTEPEEQLLPPTNLTISLVENNKIQINWVGNSTNETAYFIDRKLGTYNWLENFGEVVASITSFTDNIPTNSDTVFSYRIRAFDNVNYSAYSDTIAWFSINSAPSNLVLEQIAQDSIKLTWNDNSIGEQNFRLDRKIGNGNWQINYKILEPDTTSYIDYNTSLYDTCYYKVFAVCGNSYSNSTQNYFIPFLPAPSNLQIEGLSLSSIKLSWKDNSNGEEGFKIDRKVGSENWVTGYGVVEAGIEELIDIYPVLYEILYYRVYAYWGENISSSIEGHIYTTPGFMIIKIPNSGIIDNSTRPSLYNGTIAWHDGTSNGDLFYWDGTNITTVTSECFGGDISLYDGTIAWCHNAGVNNGTRVYYWDGNTISNISGDLWAGWLSLYNGQIAFSGTLEGSGIHHLHFWDGTTTIQITDSLPPYNATIPSLHNGAIAWLVGSQGGLFYWDGSETTLITDSFSSISWKPSLFNENIAFSGYDGNDYEIYHWDGTTIIQITDNDFDDKNPSLYDGTIAWSGNHDDFWDIFYWDGDSTTQVTYNSINLYPSLYAGNIAWFGYEDGNREIFYAIQFP